MTSVKKSDKDRVIIFDTTLRDGEQCPGATMSFEEKLEVAEMLDDMGVDVIEAGFPITSEGDFQAVSEIARRSKNSIIAGLARAHPKDIDRCAEAVKFAKRGRVHTVIATSPLHMRVKLNMTPEQIVGTTVELNGIPFEVIGVTEPKGGSGFANPDDFVFAPITTVQAAFTGGTTLRTIGVSVNDPNAIAYASSAIQLTLRSRHGLAASASDDFSLVSQNQLLTVASDQSATLRNFLIGIAAIALVVGGIGIANTMLVSVRERVREIGTRKAIGARRRDIGRQFLVEAVIVSLGGALIGVVVGVLVTGPVGAAVNVPARASLPGIALAFFSSLLVGIVAGFLPARQAARLDPVEALRYE